MARERDQRLELDPVTFEVLRHRLWAINDEQAMIVTRMSGSPVVYEAYDFNSALLTPEGDCLFVGIYVARHTASIDMVVKTVISRFTDDPGINDGDVFITNDPWTGAAHMNDFVVVAPVFWGDQVICWTGITLHEVDVGGPVPGSFTVGAKDVYGEAPIIPPLKLVEKGKLRRDVEALVLRNTRTRPLNALNIRARLGSQHTTKQRILEIVRTYGVETFMATQKSIEDHVREVLRGRLLELPNGTWCEHGYIDHDGNDPLLYEMRLAMTKKNDKLIFDFGGTSPQAPGGVNCTRAGLVGGVVSAILPMLCYDLPWATAGLKGVVEIISEEGTLNNAAYPAACSMATIEACWLTTNLANQTIGKMYACSEKFKEEVQACWSPATNSFVISGRDQYGEPLTAIFMNGVAGGSGARSYKDGIDTGGYLCSTYVSLANVETNERNYPILEVYRRQRPGTGGHGKFRGGLGLEYMLVPHKTTDPITEVLFSRGVSQPEGRGIYGGFPSSVQGHLMLRDANVRQMLKDGKVPTELDEISYRQLEVLPAKGITRMGINDAEMCFMAGGGGYGDPLERDPALVSKDVRQQLCSLDTAEKVYGVILRPDEIEVDIEATEKRRQEIRNSRLEQGKLVAEGDGITARKLGGVGQIDLSSGDEVLMPLGDHMRVVALGGQRLIQCSTCDYIYGPVTEDPKRHSMMRELPIHEISSLNRYGDIDNIVIREFFCPKCASMIAVNVQQRRDPILWETHLEDPG